MSQSLTSKQIELLRKLEKAGGHIDWAILRGPENANGTRLEKSGLCRWEFSAKHSGWPEKDCLHITDAGRAALASRHP